ncbi:MAG: ester cyclase [Candidatus Limnocylindria bacterium]
MDAIEENKRVARRILRDVVGGGQDDLLEELIGDEFVTEPPDGAPGPAGYRSWVTGLRSAFPDLTMEIEDQIAEGHKVATRYVGRATHSSEHMGVPPTGRRFETRGIVIHEVHDGKITNYWLHQDDLGTLRQLTS